MVTRAWPHLAFWVVLAAFALLPPQSSAQSPANCPTTVNPGWIGYPGNVIDFNDGLRSGRFRVWALVNRTGVADDLMTYTTDPGVPWDILFASKEWYMAGITTQCTQYVVDGQTWTIVQELNKSGYIGYDDQLACATSGGDDPGRTAFADAAYDPYSPSGSEEPECDPGGSGGDGPEGNGGGECRTEFLAIEISYDGGRTWSTWWEGYATTCG